MYILQKGNYILKQMSPNDIRGLNGPSNGLLPQGRQTIICIHTYPAYWRIYPSPGFGVLTDPNKCQIDELRAYGYKHSKCLTLVCY